MVEGDVGQSPGVASTPQRGVVVGTDSGGLFSKSVEACFSAGDVGAVEGTNNMFVSAQYKRAVCVYVCALLQAHLSRHQQLALHLFGTHDVVHAGPEDEGSDPASLATAPFLGRSSGVTGSTGAHVVTPHGRVGVTHYRTRVDGLFAVRIRDY